jgi:glycosyltransferase involved in cell wall biosynthesis
LLVPPGDVAACADGLKVMLTDTDRATQMGVAARAFVAERFGASTIAARWIANYRLAIERS